ncbi:hypothetical protein I6B53_03375 [Schaalia sp. 19OD2882]|uniref:hypothetical protein n=1 Tax=Schaalia sp. 19OD2882 TaxID=2794089 RepID=UPI001C1F0677|nr:hypothetical protein [Schaalia sp. 19OD2882]QWW20152.1 hypothetical protein I6B53_03375 [Schaalia sp. 19OD2882]
MNAGLVKWGLRLIVAALVLGAVNCMTSLAWGTVGGGFGLLGVITMTVGVALVWGGRGGR